MAAAASGGTSDAIEKCKERMDQLVQMAKNLKENRLHPYDNAFIRTEAAVGWLLGMHISFPIATLLIGRIADIRDRVSVLPELLVNQISKPEPTDDEYNISWHARMLRFTQIQNRLTQRLWSLLPDFKKTKLARIVIVPVGISADFGGHANCITIDRKHMVAVVSEPHGKAKPFVLQAARDFLGSSYTVESALNDIKLQSSLPYCATWASFHATEIAVATLESDDSASVIDIAKKIESAYKDIQDKVQDQFERFAHRQTMRVITLVAPVIAAGVGQMILREYGPGGGHIGSVLREVMPQILMCHPLKALDGVSTQDTPEFSDAITQWLHIMHARPKCAYWRKLRGKKGFMLTLGFKPVVMGEASSNVRGILLKEILNPEGIESIVLNSLLQRYTKDKTKGNLLLLHDELKFLPKVPASERLRAYFPSKAGAAIIKLLGILPHAESHSYLFGRGADEAIRRSWHFLRFHKTIATHPKREALTALVRGLRHSNGGFGHLWIEGKFTPRFEEEWKKIPGLPDLKEFIENPNSSLLKHANEIQIFNQRMRKVFQEEPPSFTSEAHHEEAHVEELFEPPSTTKEEQPKPASGAGSG